MKDHTHTYTHTPVPCRKGSSDSATDPGLTAPGITPPLSATPGPTRPPPAVRSDPSAPVATAAAVLMRRAMGLGTETSSDAPPWRVFNNNAHVRWSPGATKDFHIQIDDAHFKNQQGFVKRVVRLSKDALRRAKDAARRLI
eukprot:1158221-Pelagomonas_calceolata.AAC.2